MIKKTIKFLSSLRFTIVLICLLGMMFIIGLWVPQKKLLQAIYLDWRHNSPVLVGFLDATGLTYIYTSPITITLWVFFFINLSLVLWQFIPVVKSRITLSERKIVDPATAGGYPFRTSYPLAAGKDGETVLAGLRKKGYAVIGTARGFYGMRNRHSPLAFLLFHISFFLVLLGGLITVYTKFYGYVDLAQGEQFTGALAQYNKKPRPKLPEIGSPPDTRFTVESITPRVTGNTPTGISVILADDKAQKHEIGINTPFKTPDTSFVFDQLGVAPLAVLKDASGREIDGAYSKLDVMLGREDKFALGGFLFTVNFFPDFALEKGQPVSRSQEFKNPTFNIVVSRDGKKIAEGNVGKNGAFAFNGYRLEIQDMLFWVRLQVVKQHGISILYFGFLLATVGVIWRLLFYRREIVGAVREQNGEPILVIAARSEYYKNLAEDEFTRLFHEILDLPEASDDAAELGAAVKDGVPLS